MQNELYDLFIGPKAENIETLKRLMNKVLDHHAQWRRENYPYDPSLYRQTESGSGTKLENELEKFLERSDDNLPYFHPRYVAQMLKDPTIPTVLGYMTFMLSNPNNHAYEGGPVTTEMEMEVTEMMLKMCGFEEGWGHLASGGSLANMEALWAARDFYKEGTVYFSEMSHYSWKRICTILRIDKWKELPADSSFRLDLEALEQALQTEPALMVMANMGATGSGAIDDIEKILALREQCGFHLHIDAAYGGFARSAMLDENYTVQPYNEETPMTEYTHRQLELLKEADSVTIDPHKLGLISYGAGAVLFKNEEMRKIILNTAPYTYHKTDKPNIGMFSLEGSRPGAMAAACYLTYKTLPPNKTGIGSVITESMRAAKQFAAEISASSRFAMLHTPDLDLTCFYAKAESLSEINRVNTALYKQFSVEADEPEFILSKFVLPAEAAAKALPDGITIDTEIMTSLRIVWMKHWATMNDGYYIKLALDHLYRAVEEL